MRFIPTTKRRGSRAYATSACCIARASSTDFDRKTAGFSPDRVDALVWAMSDLLVEPMPGEAMIEFYRLRAREAAEKKAAAEQVGRRRGARSMISSFVLR
jgi:hypothetical protein